MIRRLVLLVALLLYAQPALAQTAPGNWSGGLQVTPAALLNLVVHIQAAENGALQGTMDSPDQGAFGIALANINGVEARLSFDVPSVGGRFEGRWDANKWTGRWTQGANTWPLDLAAAPAPAPPQPLPANWAIPDDATIGRLIDERITGRAGEGIVVAVIEPTGRRVVARGPAGFDGRTLFEIGSMTKVFTSLLLADMVRRGEVALSDPAARYLPEGAHMPERNGRRITLHDLATHRSGLPRLPDNFAPADSENPYADYSEAQLLDFLGRYQLTRDIDSQFEYSNLGVGLLGYLLSRRAGMSYEALVHERITGPLGLADTMIALSPEQQARFATGHDAYMRPAPPWDLPTLAGAGALRSTANDLATFLAAAMGEGPPALVEDMRAMTAQRRAGPRPPVQIGLAWLILPGPAGEIVMHDGGTGGFRTTMAYDAGRRRGVIVLTNAAVEPSSSDLAMHLLIGAPLAPLQPVPPAPNAGRTEVTVPADQLERLTGRYVLTPQLTIEISRDGDRLMAQVTGAPKFRLHAEGPLDYFWREVNAQIRFVPEAEARIGSVVFRQDGVELVGRRAP